MRPVANAIAARIARRGRCEGGTAPSTGTTGPPAATRVPRVKRSGSVSSRRATRTATSGMAASAATIHAPVSCWSTQMSRRSRASNATDVPLTAASTAGRPDSTARTASKLACWGNAHALNGGGRRLDEGQVHARPRMPAPHVRKGRLVGDERTDRGRPELQRGETGAWHPILLGGLAEPLDPTQERAQGYVLAEGHQALLRVRLTQPVGSHYDHRLRDPTVRAPGINVDQHRPVQLPGEREQAVTGPGLGLEVEPNAALSPHDGVDVGPDQVTAHI